MPKFKVGDKVRCIVNESSEVGTGVGWSEGLEFEVHHIRTGCRETCYFPEHGNGVFESHLELVEEVQEKHLEPNTIYVCRNMEDAKRIYELFPTAPAHVPVERDFSTGYRAIYYRSNNDGETAGFRSNHTDPVEFAKKNYSKYTIVEASDFLKRSEPQRNFEQVANRALNKAFEKEMKVWSSYKSESALAKFRNSIRRSK